MMVVAQMLGSPVQFQLVSSRHDDEQPSPLSGATNVSGSPSSHCSAPRMRPSPQIARQPELEQRKPSSTSHTLEQPSPSSLSPSSQLSTRARTPSPHSTSTQAPVGGHSQIVPLSSSSWQSSSQPSSASGGSWPSSHCSPRSRVPLPHTATSTHGSPGLTHCQPSSTSSHLALQPSPSLVSPSSQASLPSITPLPHATTRIHGSPSSKLR